MHQNWKLITRKLILIPIFLFNFGCQKEVGAGSTAPNFSLSDLSGRVTSLLQHRGSVVFLDFWATWCPPCRMSIPELINVQEKFRNKGLVVLGVSMDDPRMVNDKELLNFKQKVHINYTILRVNQKILQDYFGDELISLPTMFIIDADGKIRDRVVGFIPGAYEKFAQRLVE
jgi:cytochrome c biogenesis protein CcmG/thiol:disulfide interchange protein DsbE